MGFPFQKIAIAGTAVATVGTGAVVGGKHVVDNATGGPARREEARVEQLRQIVSEEVYKQLVNAFPNETGPVKGEDSSAQNYRTEVPLK
jgi:hypothetical protein